MGRFLAFFGFALAALLAGCQSANTIAIPRLPAWRSPTNTATLSTSDVRAAVVAIRPGVPVLAADSTYTRVSHAWLEAYVSWCWEAAKADGVSYAPESFDCDDFALAFHLFATRAAARAGVKAAPLVARIVVQQGPGARHELNAVATDRGIFIVEPQPDSGPFRIVPLAAYSPRILSVTLGDFNPL